MNSKHSWNVKANSRTNAPLSLILALAVFLCMLPISFITLFSAAGLAIKPFHVCFLVLIMLSAPRMLRSGKSVWRRMWNFEFTPFCFFYAVYLAILGVSALNLDVESQHLLVKYTSYFISFVLLYMLLRDPSMSPASLGRAVYLGSPLGIAVWLGIAAFVFHQLGRNYFSEYLSAVSQFDSTRIQFRLYVPILNYASGERVSRDSAEFISASMRNMIVGVFMLYVILVWTYSTVKISYRHEWVSLACRWSVTIAGVFLVLTSLSRSNIFVLILVYVCVMAVAFVRPGHRRLKTNLAVIVLLLGMLVGMGIVLAPASFHQLVADRFSFETFSRDSRVEMFQFAVEKIADRPLQGHGLGAEIGYSGHSRRVHNLFLASWYEAGFAAFLFAFLFWMHVVVVWCNFFRKQIGARRNLASTVSPAWVLALPVLPLFRSMESGAGGNFSLIEWCCLSFFFALTASSKNDNSAEPMESEIAN